MHAPTHAPTYSAMHVPTHAPTYSAMHAPMHAVKLPKKNLFIWLYILLAILILAIVMYFLIEKNLIKLPTF
jgi:peptidoglycan/LPS O-acetylase OafA/YrhL